MSTWLTETEFRQSDAKASGVTINVAFLREIKEDHLCIREKTQQIDRLFKRGMSPREAFECLSDFRDSLETYFALEEFYGYFNDAQITNPLINNRANELQSEHEQLFNDVNELIELTEQIVYRECGPNLTLAEVSDLFEGFAFRLEAHEHFEMDLMLRLCNEEFGVGD